MLDSKPRYLDLTTEYGNKYSDMDPMSMSHNWYWTWVKAEYYAQNWDDQKKTSTIEFIAIGLNALVTAVSEGVLNALNWTHEALTILRKIISWLKDWWWTLLVISLSVIGIMLWKMLHHICKKMEKEKHR